MITGTHHAYNHLIEHLLPSSVCLCEEPKVRQAFILDALYQQQRGASTSESPSGTELGLRCPLDCLLGDCSLDVQLDR